MSKTVKIDDEASFAADINQSLIANLNHALRTPLNGVVGIMDLLAKTGLNDNQLRYAHIIRESTELLMLQLDNMLELSRIRDGAINVQSGPCSLRACIKEALMPTIVSAVKKGIPLSVDIDTSVPDTIETDARKLRLVLTNLFSSALKFAERGKIVLKVTYEETGDADNPDPKLRFIFENSKILHDALQSAMEEAREINPSNLKEFGDITVSLMTAQLMLKALGTHIRFDPLAEGHEPPFHFELDYIAAKTPPPPGPYKALEGKRALIVQSDILERTPLTQALSLWDIDTRVISDADDIADALSEAYREGGDIDLLVVTGAVSSAQLAPAIEKGLPIIAATAKEDLPEDAPGALAARLLPPLYPDEILSSLSALYADSAVEHERSLSQEASYLVGGIEYEALTARVLVVEDDTTSRLYAAELLEGFGCEVATAENGRQALSRLSKDSGYDVIFMDCMMPLMDGYTATQELRAKGHHDLPVIALTANTMHQDRDKCLAAGMNDYITKPVREKDLHAMLKKYLKT